MEISQANYWLRKLNQPFAQGFENTRKLGAASPLPESAWESATIDQYHKS